MNSVFPNKIRRPEVTTLTVLFVLVALVCMTTPLTAFAKCPEGNENSQKQSVKKPSSKDKDKDDGDYSKNSKNSKKKNGSRDNDNYCDNNKKDNDDKKDNCPKKKHSLKLSTEATEDLLTVNADGKSVTINLDSVTRAEIVSSQHHPMALKNFVNAGKTVHVTVKLTDDHKFTIYVVGTFSVENVQGGKQGAVTVMDNKHQSKKFGPPILN